MNYKIFSLISFFTIELAMAAITEVDQPIGKLFIPEGYDSNDSIQVLATGRFKNTCYQLGLADSRVNTGSKEIKLSLKAYRYEGKCLPVEAPFLQTFYLGRINIPGDYSILSNQGKLLGKITIGNPLGEGGTDNSPYATITDAFFNEDTLHLRGIYSNSCLRVKNIEVRNQGDVLVVLPFLEMDTSSPPSCFTTETPFEITEPIHERLPKKFLLHVRTMGGQAINKMVLRSSLGVGGD